MGLFDRSSNSSIEKIFKKYKREYGEEILNTAKLISGNDPEITRAMEFAVTAPMKYFADNEERFLKRGIKYGRLSRFDIDELLFLAMIDELKECRLAVEFDEECPLEEFLSGLEGLKNFGLMTDIVRTVKFNGDENIEAWGEEINAAFDKTYSGVLDKKSVLCYMDIDVGSYPLTILTYGTLGELSLPYIMAL